MPEATLFVGNQTVLYPSQGYVLDPPLLSYETTPYFPGAYFLLGNLSVARILPSDQSISMSIEEQAVVQFTPSIAAVFRVVRTPVYATISPDKGFVGFNITITPALYGKKNDFTIFRVDSCESTHYVTVAFTFPNIKGVELIPRQSSSVRGAFELVRYEGEAGAIKIRSTYGYFSPCTLPDCFVKYVNDLSELEGFTVAPVRYPVPGDALIATVNGSTFVSPVVRDPWPYQPGLEAGIGFLLLYIFIVLMHLREQERAGQARRRRSSALG